MVDLKFPRKVLLILEKERSSLYSENPRATAAGRRNKQSELWLCGQEPLGNKLHDLDGDPCAFPVSPRLCRGIKRKLRVKKMEFCQEPAWEIPPTTRSCRRDLTGKADQDSTDPLDLLEDLPQNQNLSVLTLMGGYPQPTFSIGNQLRALANKSPGHNRSVSIQTPQMSF